MSDYRSAREDGLGAGDVVPAAELEKKAAAEPDGKEKTLDDAASKSNPYLPRAVFHHLEDISDLSNGPQVYAALAADPGLCQHLSTLSRSKSAVAIGRLSASLERGERARSSAPPPIRPVSGGTSRSTMPLGETSYQDYKKLRDQGRVR
jgi:hypothetical protein